MLREEQDTLMSVKAAKDSIKSKKFKEHYSQQNHYRLKYEIMLCLEQKEFILGFNSST